MGDYLLKMVKGTTFLSKKRGISPPWRISMSLWPTQQFHLLRTTPGLPASVDYMELPYTTMDYKQKVHHTIWRNTATTLSPRPRSRASKKPWSLWEMMILATFFTSRLPLLPSRWWMWRESTSWRLLKPVTTGSLLRRFPKSIKEYVISRHLPPL